MATKRRKVDAKCKWFNGAENIQMVSLCALLKI